VVGEVTAAQSALYRRAIRRAPMPQAGWHFRRVLSDDGREFEGAFSRAAPSDTFATRTKPRHPWTNDFVETRARSRFSLLTGVVVRDNVGFWWRVRMARSVGSPIYLNNELRTRGASG
jgi:hypothetical protein